jgi:hypothetical protein
MPVIIDYLPFLLLLSLVAICSKNSNQYQIAVSDFPLQPNSKFDWRHSLFVSVKILRAQNPKCNLPRAGRRVNLERSRDEASNRLTRQPATTIEPKIRAHNISATAPVKYKSGRCDGKSHGSQLNHNRRGVCGGLPERF